MEKNFKKFIKGCTLQVANLPTGSLMEVSLEEDLWRENIVGEFQCDIEEAEVDQNTSVSGELTVGKFNHPDYKTIVTLTGQVETVFYTECVRCLTKTLDRVECEIKACAINEQFEKDPELEDLDTLLFKNEELDLFFFSSQHQLDLAQLLFECLFLLKTPFPLHSPDCKGLCQQCGVNLNEETCSH